MQVLIRTSGSLAVARPYCRKGCSQVLNLSSARMRTTRCLCGSPRSLSTGTQGDNLRGDPDDWDWNAMKEFHQKLSDAQIKAIKEVSEALGKIGDGKEAKGQTSEIKSYIKEIKAEIKDDIGLQLGALEKTLGSKIEAVEKTLGSKIEDLKTDQNAMQKSLEGIKKFMHQAQALGAALGAVSLAGLGAVTKGMKWW
jgi:flagellin-like hook-associated protein FlgL